MLLQLMASELSDADQVDDDAIRAVIDFVFDADKMEEPPCRSANTIPTTI